MYNFNLKQLIGNILPTGLRANVINYFAILLSPLTDIHNNFRQFRNAQLNAMSYNCQYPSLQKLLNDKFDSLSRRIKVYDGAPSEPVIVFPQVDDIPVITPLLVLLNDATEYYPFIVELPSSFNSDVTRLVAIWKTVDRYKLSGINYKVIFT